MKSLLALFLLCFTAVLHAQTVTSLNTTSGSTAGGTSVTLTGTGFTGATGVSFGGVNAASFTVVNDTTITATTAAGSAGSASVLITTPGGTNSANTLFTYIVPFNVALSKPVIRVSSEYAGQFSASKVTDGSTSDSFGNNYWITPDNQGVGAFFTLDLQGVFSLTQIKLRNTNNTGYIDRGTGGFRILASNSINGSNQLISPQTILTGTLTEGSGTLVSFTTSNGLTAGNYRYLHFIVDSLAPWATTGSAGLNEIEAYALPAPSSAPTDITLTPASIAENNAANAAVGTLSTTDADVSDTFTYTLVGGTGSTDNAAFNMSGAALRLTAAPNFEVQNSYSVRVRSTDAGGAFFEKPFTITITNVIETPVIASPTSTNLTPTTVTLGGNVTSDGGLAVTERGVVYALTATNSNPQIGGTGVTKVAGSGSTGVFTVDVSGLNASTAYSYAAYVTNADATRYTSAGTFTTTASFVLGTGVTTTYSAVISGATPVSIIGGGTLALTHANTYTAPTNVQSGTVSINTVGTGTTAQSLGAGSVVNLGVASTSSGSLVYTGGAGTLDKTINALGHGSDTVQNSGTGLLTLSGTLNKTGTTLTLQGGANGITVSGSITGNTGSPNSDLIVDGGTVTLASANTYNGPTYIINGGTLNANAVDALPTSVARTAIIMDQTGSGSSTLALGVSQSALSLTGASSSNINLNAHTLTVGTTSGSTTLAGVISGSGGGLIKDGASTQILSGANTYTGATTVTEGTLALSGAGRLSDSSSLVVNGGSFDLGSVSDSVAGVQLTSGSITGSSGVLTSASTYDVQGGSVSAILGGSMGLTKTTAGTVTLSGINTYTGATLLSAGDLVVNGSIGSSSPATTIIGGTLMGTGTVGAIQLNSGGAINPAGLATAGTLNTGSIAIVDGQLRFNLGGTGVGQYDQLSTTGAINLAASGAGAKLVLDAISGYGLTLALNDAWTLVSNDLADAVSGAFAKGTFGGTKVVRLSDDLDYVEGLLGTGYYGRINYAGSSDAPGALATAGNDIVLKVVTPEISITESGNNVGDGSTYDFGSVDKVIPSVSLIKTFTIKNEGEVDLMGIWVHAATGPAAADYTVDASLTAAVLRPGASTTFKVTFDPTRIGTRPAAIVIDNNDLNENPFNIALTGSGNLARDIQYVWKHSYGGPDAPGTPRSGAARAVAVQKSTTKDEALAVFATGCTTNAAGNKDVYTTKYHPVTGAVIWERFFDRGVGRDDECVAIAVDHSGAVIVTGYTTNAAGHFDVLTVKYASDGTPLWDKIYSGLGNNHDSGNSVAVDASGNVAVAGYGVNAAGGMDWFVARYSSDGSTTYFEQLVEGGNHRTDAASAVAVDAAGNLLVAGYKRNALNNKDFMVRKLSAANGVEQWQWVVNGPSNTDDEAFGVAVDSSGAVFATGTVRGIHFDLYTVKLNSAGAMQWANQSDSGFSSSDAGYQVVVDSQGDVAVAGVSYAPLSDGYVVKYSGATGAQRWSRRFNGAASQWDYLTSIDLDLLGNVVVVGTSQNANGSYDVLTAKMLAADGGLLWEQRFDGSGTGLLSDLGNAVAVSPDGNIFVAGSATVETGAGEHNPTDFLVVNYNAIIPAVQAAQTITFANPGAQSSSTPLNLVATASSGLAVHFTVISGPAQMDPVVNTRLNFTGNGSVTVRASQSGNRVLDAAPSVNQTFTVNRVAQTLAFTLPATLSSTAQWPLTGVASSGLAVTYSILSDPGSIASISGGILSFTGIGSVTVRASQAGDGRFNAAVDVDSVVSVFNNAPILMLDNVAENWRDLFPGSGAGEGNDIALQLSGNDAVAGFVAGYTSTGTGKDLYLAKYHSNGTKRWTRISGTSGDDEARAVVVDGNGDVVVAGYITGANGQDVFVAKYNGGSGGAPIWSYSYNGAGNGNDVGVSLALQGLTNVVVGGYAVGAGTSNDFFAAKLDLTTGAAVWTSTQNRTTTTSDVPARVVVGTDGSVVLAGITNSDAWTVKLAASNGTKVWEQRYNFANKPDAVRGLALDGANNVIIAAYSQGNNYDMYTAKYAALDGSLIWGQRYNSSFNSSDAPWDMALDEDANVYVTGASYRSASVRDGMTLKYAGLNGTLLWEGRYNGTSSANDENFTIALDGIGNPVISGYTTNTDGSTDVYLAKHNKGPGTLRWQRSFDGANNKNDNVKKVCADPNGNVWMAGSVTSSGGQKEVLMLRHIPAF
ncbi:MAG: autotransporter-associated beta strand repeat-containing protein [Verrucomicrobiota bacterium]|nr:autotransporter-associated beta strand repeat-containing protein [Verrucomicrobiota bacterium]